MKNRVTLIGNLGQDPIIRTTSEGKEIATFSLATTETWKDKISGEKKSDTEWHNLVVYNEKIVDFCKKYAKKGTKVYIEGQIKTRKWCNANELKPRYITEIILKNNGVLQMLDSRQKEIARSFHDPEETGIAKGIEEEEYISF